MSVVALPFLVKKLTSGSAQSRGDLHYRQSTSTVIDMLFLTPALPQSKLWCTYHAKVEENLDITLKDLGVDYVDLYLIHWPVPMNPNGNHPMFPKKEDGSRDVLTKHSVEKDTWKSMEAVYKSGKAKGTA